MKISRRARRQRLEQALPHPLPGPAVADCRMRPAALRKVAPRRAGAQDVKDPADRPPVVHPWNAPRLVRRQRRDDRPFRIRQVVAALHPQSPAVWKLESHQRRKENPFSLYEYKTWARDLLRIATVLRIPRVVLVGDSKQVDAVDAGKPFAQLQATGMKTAIMDEIMRQRDPDLKAAVEASLAGEIGKAFEKLGANVAEVKADNIAGRSPRAGSRSPRPSATAPG